MSVTAAKGFVAAGLHCGIKPSGAPDLALVATDDGVPVPAAAVFTSNLATAAPVIVSRAHLDATAGHAAAVVLNSGNANAATGRAGVDDAERTCALVARDLGCRTDDVLVCSTGLIGIPLEMDAIEKGVGPLVAARAADGGQAAADAILTTDTVRKEAVSRGRGFTVGGMAKGAAMLAPDMATMLAVLTTDAAVDPVALRAALVHGVDDSFNALSVDGCTSTNDTVMLLASGRAGVPDEAAFREAVREVCTSLAAQMCADAEGATKSVRVRVVGARSREEARRAARKVAESQLVKCSWYGRDPYWGRIASELGTAGIAFEPDKLSVRYGDLVVTANLGLGDGTARILTNDLTHAYVDENMGTS